MSNEQGLSAESVIHILNTHFPTNWANENLRERVIEFGLDVATQAAPDLPSVEELETLMDGAIEKAPDAVSLSFTVASAVLDFLRSRAK